MSTAAAFAYRAKQRNSSESEEDSDQECSDWKRATRNQEHPAEQIPIDPLPTEPEAPITKRKRNNIWCEVLEDQLLSESLNHCGVKQKPKNYGDRGEESYDYTLARKYYKKDKTTDQEMSNGANSDSVETSSVASSFRDRRFNKKHHVKLDSAGMEAARKIVKTLGEQKPYLIFRVVKFVGIEKAMQILQKTEEVEEKGGMMIKNNARRRTPGGVYFQLLKSDPEVEKAAVDKVFEGEMNSFEIKRLYEERRKQKKKQKSAALKERKKAECAALKATELLLPLPSVAHQQPEVNEENVTQMEEDSMLVEESATSLAAPQNGEEPKELDLEDGEIGD